MKFIATKQLNIYLSQFIHGQSTYLMLLVGSTNGPMYVLIHDYLNN